MQLKTTMKKHFTFTRMAILKIQTMTSAGEHVGELDPLYFASGVVKCSYCGKQFDY